MTDAPGAGRKVADLIYDAFYGGAIGGSVIALFYLIVDLSAREPLFTPSLLGTVLFAGVPAEAVTGVRLDMVAYFTIVHFLGFGALGTGISVLIYKFDVLARRPGMMALILLITLEIGFTIPVSLFAPGVIDRIGLVYVFVGNLLTAGAMTLFLLRAHRPVLQEYPEGAEPVG